MKQHNAFVGHLSIDRLEDKANVFAHLGFLPWTLKLLQCSPALVQLLLIDAHSFNSLVELACFAYAKF